MARPKKEIGKKSFENLCALQCTKEEICGFFDITDKTLDRWCKETYKAGFSDVFRQKRGAGKISLRRSQFRLAEKNAAMAIWLGKQYLNQSEGMVIEERRARINKLQAEVARITEDDSTEMEDDGFIEALEGKLGGVWVDGEEAGDIPI